VRHTFKLPPVLKGYTERVLDSFPVERIENDFMDNGKRYEFKSIYSDNCNPENQNSIVNNYLAINKKELRDGIDEEDIDTNIILEVRENLCEILKNDEDIRRIVGN